MRTLARVVVAIAAGAALTIGWTSIVLQGIVTDVGSPAVFVTLVVIVGQVAGWMIGRRRPDWFIGLLVQATSLVLAAEAARAADLGPLVPRIAGLWLATLLLPAVMLVATPEAIASRFAPWTLVGGIVATASLAYPIVDAAGGRARASVAWWETNSFETADAGARRLFEIHAFVVTAVLVVVVVTVVRHYVGLPRGARAVGRPIFVAGILWALATVISQLARIPDSTWAHSAGQTNFTPSASLVLQVAPLVTLATLVGAVVWVELVVPRLVRTPSGALRGDGHPEDVAAFLSRVLADRSVAVFFWSDRDDSWRDHDGRAVELPVDDRDRAVTIVSRSGERVAAFVHDAAWASQPQALAAVALAAAFEVDSNRLTALANARLDEARRLTSRLVSAADEAREDLRRELAAGSLRELDELATDLERDGASAADRLQRIAADVRRLSHGVFPPVLTEHGLSAALTDAADVALGRYPPSIEITVYLSAVGDPGARVYEIERTLVVELSRPPSSDHVVDRVAVLGGRVKDAAIYIPLTPVGSAPELDLVSRT
jgi:hypothetical protein